MNIENINENTNEIYKGPISRGELIISICIDYFIWSV